MSFWCCAQLENNHIGLALHCLALAGYQTYAPRLRTVRVAHGRKLESRPLLFPSYVFVWIVAQWHAARWAPGVTRLVMAGDAVPARVPDGVIDELRAREGRDGGDLTSQALLLRAGCALGQFHQLLELDALFRFLAAYFLGPLLQASFVLLKRDPDDQIAANNLTAKGGLARALLVLLC
jgi:hypothetical protein